MIDFFAYYPHLIDHLAPVWHALPEQTRGRFMVNHEMLAYAIGHGIPAVAMVDTRGDTMVCARAGDLRRDRHEHRILLSHGIDQTYSNSHSSYVDGSPAWVDLHLVPSERSAQLVGNVLRGDGGVEPKAVVVGCPKLDRWQGVKRPTGATPTVAFAWHWDASDVAPEAGTAWPEYARAVEMIAADHGRGYQLLGHAHPRILDEIVPAYVHAGIPVASRLDHVLAEADVLVADNTSALYEFAALDRPVVVVNSNHYRRDVQHGARFWEWADVGVQVDHPAELADAITLTLRDDPQAVRRRQIVAEAYTYRDGHCAERAAAAILEHVGVHA